MIKGSVFKLILRINTKLILEYMDKLVEYDDYIPTLIRFLVDERYYRNLTRNGSIDKVLDKILETQKYSYNEQIQEVQDWCKKNKEFIDLIRM